MSSLHKVFWGGEKRMSTFSHPGRSQLKCYALLHKGYSIWQKWSRASNREAHAGAATSLDAVLIHAWSFAADEAL
jgi:hypothetical protein